MPPPTPESLRHPSLASEAFDLEKKQVGILCFHIVGKEGLTIVTADDNLKFACMDYLTEMTQAGGAK